MFLATENLEDFIEEIWTWFYFCLTVWIQLPLSAPQVEAPLYMSPKTFSIFCFSRPPYIYIRFIS